MLVGKIRIGIIPTFINHMVNELEEYMKILVRSWKENQYQSMLHCTTICSGFPMLEDMRPRLYGVRCG